MLVWLITDRSPSLRVERRPLSFFPTLFPSGDHCSGLSIFRKFLKPLSTSALHSNTVLVMSAVFASRSAHSFLLTLAWQGQDMNSCLFGWKLIVCGACQSGQPIPDPPCCSRFTESVRMMALAVIMSLWGTSPCTACETVHISTARLEAMCLVMVTSQ